MSPSRAVVTLTDPYVRMALRPVGAVLCIVDSSARRSSLFLVPIVRAGDTERTRMQTLNAAFITSTKSIYYCICAMPRPSISLRL